MAIQLVRSENTFMQFTHTYTYLGVHNDKLDTLIVEVFTGLFDDLQYNAKYNNNSSLMVTEFQPQHYHTTYIGNSYRKGKKQGTLIGIDSGSSEFHSGQHVLVKCRLLSQHNTEISRKEFIATNHIVPVQL